jgi:hypothetical protein
MGALPVAAVTWFDLAPFQLEQYGTIGLEASYNKGAENYSRELSLVGDYTGQAYSSGYIYRPWVLSMNTQGRLNGQIQQYDVYANQLQNAITWGLGSNFVLFPVDKSPTNFYVNFDQTIAVGATDNTFDSLKLGVNNTISFEQGNLGNRYEFRNEKETKTERDFKVHELDLNYTGAFDDQNNFANLRVEYRDASTQLIDNSELNTLLGYNHNVRYGENSSSSLGTSYSMANRSSEQTNIDLLNTRIFNNNYWSMADIPELSMQWSNQIYRFEQLGQNEAGEVDIEQLTLSSNFNTDYEWSDELSNFASVMVEDTGSVGNLNGEQFYDSNTRRYFERLGGRWRDNFDLGFASYNPFTSLSANAVQGDSEKLNVLMDFSHGLRKNILVGEGSVNMALNQAYSNTYEFIDIESPEDRLSHNFDVNWSFGSDGQNTNIFGRLSHDMSLDVPDRKQESLDIGVDVSQYQGSRISFGGNLNYNWSKNYYSKDVVFTSNTGYGRFWYNHKDLFDVYGLYFESNLNVPFVDVFFNDGSNQSNVSTLDFLLRYNLGLLEFRVNSVFSETTEFYAISARRRF